MNDHEDSDGSGNEEYLDEMGFRASRSRCPKLVTKIMYVPIEMQMLVLSSRNLATLRWCNLNLPIQTNANFTKNHSHIHASTRRPPSSKI